MVNWKTMAITQATSSTTTTSPTNSYVAWHNGNDVGRKYYNNDIDLSPPETKLTRELRENYGITLSTEKGGKFEVKHIPDYTNIDVGNGKKIVLITTLKMKRYKKPLIETSVDFRYGLFSEKIFGRFENEEWKKLDSTGWFDTVKFNIGDYVSSIIKKDKEYSTFHGRITKIDDKDGTSDAQIYTIEGKEKSIRVKAMNMVHVRLKIGKPITIGNDLRSWI